MKKVIAAAVAVIALSGCASQQSISISQVESVEVSEFAPQSVKDNAANAFLIGYNSAGYTNSINERREMAYERMWNHCNGDYEIISQENTNLDLANFKSCTDSTCIPSPLVQHTTVITFVCN